MEARFQGKWPDPRAGEECRDSSPKEEGGENMWRTDCNPHSLFSWATNREEIENSEAKLSLGRREGWWGGFILIFYVISYYPTLIWLAKMKLISLRQFCFPHDTNLWVISLCPYLDPWAFSYNFSLLCRWGKVIQWIWWAPVIQSRPNHHTR